MAYDRFYEALDEVYGIVNPDTRLRLEKQFDNYVMIAATSRDPMEYNLYRYSKKDTLGVSYDIFVSTVTEPARELGKYTLGVTHKVYTAGFHIIAGVEDYATVQEQYSKAKSTRMRSKDSTDEYAARINRQLNIDFAVKARQYDTHFSDNNPEFPKSRHNADIPVGRDVVMSYTSLAPFINIHAGTLNATNRDIKEIRNNETNIGINDIFNIHAKTTYTPKSDTTPKQ